MFFLSPTWIFLIVRLEFPQTDNTSVQRRKGTYYTSIISKEWYTKDYLRWNNCMYCQNGSWSVTKEQSVKRYNELLLPTERICFSRIGIKRIVDFVQTSVHPVPCSPSRLVKLSKTLHLSSDFSCKMARIMVIGKQICRVQLVHKKLRKSCGHLRKIDICGSPIGPIPSYPV